VSQFGNIRTEGTPNSVTVDGKDEVMSNGNKISSGGDPKFSFATRELREVRRAQARAVEELSRGPKNNDTGGGFDPYNSSGSFDRRKHWERVGKR
jgi:hypothetical protein